MIVCGFTGHREIPKNMRQYVESEIRHEVELALTSGCTEFISGFAQGADLQFASAIVELKRRHRDIILTAAIPYEGRLKTQDASFQELIAYCDKVNVSSKAYSKQCYAIRNRYIVDNSDRLIAVYNGQSRSGTAQTLRMARAKGIELRIISV